MGLTVFLTERAIIFFPFFFEVSSGQVGSGYGRIYFLCIVRIVRNEGVIHFFSFFFFLCGRTRQAQSKSFFFLVLESLPT